MYKGRRTYFVFRFIYEAKILRRARACAVATFNLDSKDDFPVATRKGLAVRTPPKPFSSPFENPQRCLTP